MKRVPLHEKAPTLSLLILSTLGALYVCGRNNEFSKRLLYSAGRSAFYIEVAALCYCSCNHQYGIHSNRETGNSGRVQRLEQREQPKLFWGNLHWL
jgi:hypothetical protein